MPLTAIDRRPALVVVDLQKGIVSGSVAQADPDQDVHRRSRDRVFPKLGETATTAEIIGFLDREDNCEDNREDNRDDRRRVSAPTARRGE